MLPFLFLELSRPPPTLPSLSHSQPFFVSLYPPPQRSSSAGGSDAPIISGTGNQHLGSPLSSRVHSPREPILSLYELQEDQVPARTSALLDEQHWRLRASPRGEQEQRSDRKGTDPMDPMHSLRQFLADRMQKRSQRFLCFLQFFWFLNARVFVCRCMSVENRHAAGDCVWTL